jgi:glucosamine-6-phosphate deaminase
MYKSYKKGTLEIKVFNTRAEMGKVGAEEAAAYIINKLKEKESLSIVFASAPSQMDVLNELLNYFDIDWSKINAFHMDEYVGMPADAKQSFGNYIKVRFFDKLNFKNIFYIDGMASDPEAECLRYEELLKEHGVDIVFAGIGENGHLAFNDPHIADFNDPKLVKINPQLDEACRLQQVKDGWFESIDQIPETAITLTMPAMFNAERIFTIVPGPTKAEIIKRCMVEEITTDCPATILRTHPNTTLYLDKDSAVLLKSDDFD